MIALPTLRDITAAVTGATPSGSWDHGNGRVELFSRGTWALAKIADAVAGQRRRPATMFVPDYFCNQSLAVARRSAHRLVFYPVDGELAPDWRAIRARLSETGPPDLFVTVHYFGFDADLSAASAFAVEHGAWLVEDAAHALRPTATIGRVGDAALFCPWKLLPVPEGAILVARGPAAAAIGNSNTLEAPASRRSTHYHWLARKLAQRALTAAAVPWTGSRRASFMQDSEPAVLHSPRLTTIGERLLARAWDKREEATSARRRNYAVLADALGVNGLIRPLFPVLPPQVCPYVFPIAAAGGRAAEMHAFLHRHGIPAQSWPDLPPEVSARPDRHEAAVGLRGTVMLLPLHQGLSRSQVAFVADTLNRLARGRFGDHSPKAA